MSFLQEQYFGNTVQSWLIAVSTAIAVYVALKGLQWLIVHRLAKFAKTTKTNLDDLAIEVLKTTKFFFLMAISLYAGLNTLTFSATTQRWIGNAIILVVLLQSGLWASKTISGLLERAVKNKLEENPANATTLTALGFISKLVLWTLVLLLALDNIGVNITALVTGLGIGGIAVALALQNILGDLFASLSIVLDKPFVIGDFIVVGEHVGTVEYIGLKTTRIRSLSGEQIVFSNSDLLGSRIRNFKHLHERRVVFTIGVTYQTSHEKLSKISSILKEIIVAQDLVKFDRAHFKNYGDSSLNYEVVYYVLSQEYSVYMDIQQAINLEIYRRFALMGIDFAYPTRTLYLQTENGIAPQGNSRIHGGKEYAQ